MMKNVIFIKIFFILSISRNFLINAWTPDIQPRLNLKNEQEKFPQFFNTNNTCYFKLLDQDENTILIGARNAVYNLSLINLIENYKQRIDWSSSDADRELCALKGKHETDCQNYVRVFARISDKQIMICGTNSYKPKCRYYSIVPSTNLNNNNNNNLNIINYDLTNEIPIYKISNEIEAQGRCPYNPKHNSTYIYTDGQLYSATVADFSGADSLIYREPQRTEQSDLKQLNQPAFVSTLERNGYVFFFFREIAMEYMNCGKAIYSRVGRVCKNDKGGPYGFGDRWTSFLKTRLNCSVPGEYPFYFNEIQSTSKIIENFNDENHSAIVYGVFTTSINAIPGSAVCAFSIDNILNTFEGRFKSQKDINSNWLPLLNDIIPEPRPGKCVDDSRTLSSTSVNFVKTHPLMESSVLPLYGKPLLTRVSLKYRLTAITIDTQIQTIDGKKYDIIFVGTDNGKIIKFINIHNKNINNNNNNNNENNENNFDTIVISEIQTLPINKQVRQLSISHKTNTLIVIGDDHVVSIPLNHCKKIQYCRECVKIQDPYCVWDIDNHECKTIKNYNNNNNNKFIQNILKPNDGINTCIKYGNIDGESDIIIDDSIDNNNNNNNNNNNHNNDDDDEINQQRLNIFPPTRGTVTSIGKFPHNTNYHDTNSRDNNKLPTIDIIDLKNSNNGPLIKEELGIENDNLHLGSNNIYWCFAIVILILVFAIGIFVGLYTSKKLCKTPPFHTDHRNQLSSKSLNSRTIGGGGGKDVNLLMNTNPYPTVPCNNKKDNIEHEFVSDKDRSHECKNSTENLEKDVHSKTGTLTKVKRTYI